MKCAEAFLAAVEIYLDLNLAPMERQAHMKGGIRDL
jgi:hypothetical protein